MKQAGIFSYFFSAGFYSFRRRIARTLIGLPEICKAGLSDRNPSLFLQPLQTESGCNPTHIGAKNLRLWRVANACTGLQAVLWASSCRMRQKLDLRLHR